MILDRDGVINEDSDEFVKRVAEWQPIPGSIEAIAKLSQSGVRISVATNQSGIGRALFTRETLYAMHRKMRRLVRQAGGEIEHIAFCPHLPGAGCDCRKPLPGLLHQLAQRTGLDLRDAHLVGDSARDLEAGVAVGATSWLVRTGKGQRTEATLRAQCPTWWHDVTVKASLAEVAEELLSSHVA